MPPSVGRVPVVIPANPGAEDAADLAEYQAKLDAVDPAKLSDASKRQYKNQLKRLTETVGRGVEWILSHGEEAKRLLLAAKRTDGRAMMDAPMTIKAMIDPLVAMLKHVTGLRARFPDVKSQWYELYKKAGEAANERYENNEATAKSAANFVPWSKILERRDELIRRSPASSMEVVVAALHTFIPPARADYDRVRVYTAPSLVPKDASGANYVVWTRPPSSPKQKQQGDGAMRLVLDEFKTRRKQQAAHEADLPAELVSVLARSLDAIPREFLVVSSETGAPYESANAYSKFVQRVFTRLLGRHTTVNSLRHAFSSHLDLNTLTPKQRKEIAGALMHSSDMTHRYRWANVEGATSSAASAAPTSTVQCQLVCKKTIAPPTGKEVKKSKGESKADRYRSALAALGPPKP